MWGNGSGQGVSNRRLLASRFGRYIGDGIAVGEGDTPRRTNRLVPQIGCHIRLGYSGRWALLHVQGPLLGGRLDLPQVVDAHALVRGGAGPGEGGDGDG